MSAGTSPSDFDSRWHSWLLARNRSGTRTLLLIVLFLYPAFGVLDYVIAPRHWLWLLYSTRVVVTLATIVMFRAIRLTVFNRYSNAISAIYMLLCSFGISLMTVFMGGMASPYYAGLTLAIVATGLLFVWPTRVVIITHTTILASFVIPNLAQRNGNVVAAVSNLFFLVSTGIIAGTGQILAYRTQRQQVANQLVIERTKANLEEAHEQLKKLDRFKSQFFANITHELKTPLAMILAPLELMLDPDHGTASDVQRPALQAMFRSGIKLLKLIADLLDLSKLEESRLRLRIDDHDLVDYLRGLFAQIRPLAQRKAIELHFDSNVEKAIATCDLERIERVFINLLSNATKFTPVNGNIWLSVQDLADRIHISVKDDGAGFPAEMTGRVFERFFQVDMGGTRKHGGTGIGLALAKELVELHGGRKGSGSGFGASEDRN
jgi:signal transduction histidine kinase